MVKTQPMIKKRKQHRLPGYTITNPKVHCVFDSFNLAALLVSLSDPKIITAESGQNVTLPCRASNNNFIILEWSRADLGTQHVVVYRDGHFAPDNQHPSFKNRVDLQDRQMKDGDVSLILKNVTTADNGTYECRVLMGEIHSWELNIIYLSVVDPPAHENIQIPPAIKASRPNAVPADAPTITPTGTPV
ncbi:cell surface A33 antigen-like [Oreochromis niloticus]|uniref:cell surface A33 antigen-like n=1 Tax=Oreochromis niloticus TaxID=8128 RepID=UPI000DF1F6ED|nr:cell surface A33 antigen-like [Oreochromis niloticus]